MNQQQSNAREVAVMPALPAAGVGSEATRVEQARAVAEVAAAVQVAQMYPRDERNAWLAMEAACRRKGLAERAFYDVPNRGGSQPSVHLARELARIWGNLDSGVRETHRDDDLGRSEVLAFAWDQQTNSRTSRSFIVPHVRMVGGNRRPLTDVGDVYLNNQNQGARALRQSIFAIMPADFVAEAQKICRDTLVKGDGKPLQTRIADMVEAFTGLGVDVPRMEQRIGRSRGQWTNADVADMTITYGTLSRSEVTADEAFPPVLTLDMVTASAAAPAVPPRPAAAPPAAAGNYGPGQARIPATPSQAAARSASADVARLDGGMCGFVTPDGPCNLTADHKTGPDEPGYDGHDVIPPMETQT
jgi:hypothetical protein